MHRNKLACEILRMKMLFEEMICNIDIIAFFTLAIQINWIHPKRADRWMESKKLFNEWKCIMKIYEKWGEQLSLIEIFSFIFIIEMSREAQRERNISYASA